MPAGCLRVTLAIMLDRIGHLFAPAGTHVATAGAGAVDADADRRGTAWPQAAPPPSLGSSRRRSSRCQPQPAPQQHRAASQSRRRRAENPGLINEIGKMFEQAADAEEPGRDHRRSQCARQGCRQGCHRTLSRMTTSSMVTGRVVCPVSANGAPDCKAASDKLCQSKGFKEGKSLDHRFGRNLLGESADPRPHAKARRLPDRNLRHPRAVPVARRTPSIGERIADCLVGMMSGISQSRESR